MGAFNVIQFRKETEKARRSFQGLAFNAARARFNAAVRAALEDFDSHPITQEIEAGPSADNISNTLEGKGNLFSFLGFYAEERPVRIVRQTLEQLLILDPEPVVVDKGNRIDFMFELSIPKLDDFDHVAQLQWEPGRNWLTAIEQGVSGFSYYMYWRTNLANSRSGTGLQVSNILRAGRFNNTSYLSEILRNFNKNF